MIRRIWSKIWVSNKEVEKLREIEALAVELLYMWEISPEIGSYRDVNTQEWYSDAIHRVPKRLGELLHDEGE